MRTFETIVYDLVQSYTGLSTPNMKQKVSRGQTRALARYSREVKAKDVAYDLAANTTGSVQLLNGLEPGVGFDERVGRQIRARRVELYLTSTVTAATGVDQFHRILVVLDHQPNGAAPEITDVLDAKTMRALPNLSNQARFKILHDEVIYLNASAEAGSGVARKLRIGLPFTTSFYTGGIAGTVADISTNALFLLVMGTASAGTTAGLVSGMSRFRYTDE